MKSNNKIIGDLGEKIASQYLSCNGYTIIDANFRYKTGEIDLICKDGDYLVFIEVKTRNSNYFGEPAEAVNYRKKSKIIKTAELYIMKNKLTNTDFRFDIVEIRLSKKTYVIDVIKNAF